MLIFTSHFLKVLGYVLNASFYIGSIPYKWNRHINCLELPKSPFSLGLFGFITAISFPIATFNFFKLIWIINTTNLSLIEIFNITTTVIILVLVPLVQLNTFLKLKETRDGVNKLLHFVREIQQQNSSAESYQNISSPKLLQYFYIIMTLSCLNAIVL